MSDISRSIVDCIITGKRDGEIIVDIVCFYCQAWNHDLIFWPLCLFISLASVGTVPASGLTEMFSIAVGPTLQNQPVQKRDPSIFPDAGSRK